MNDTEKRKAFIKWSYGTRQTELDKSSSYFLSIPNGVLAVTWAKSCREALDCELVYTIRPKSKEPFSEIIWKKLWIKVEGQARLKKCSPQMKSTVAAAIAKELLLDTKFRREQSWVAKN